MRSRSKIDALVENACKNGQVVDSFGDYDETTREGHDALLIKHGGLFLVIERDDDEEEVENYVDEQEARDDFEEIKEEIEDGKNDE